MSLWVAIHWVTISGNGVGTNVYGVPSDRNTRRSCLSVAIGRDAALAARRPFVLFTVALLYSLLLPSLPPSTPPSLPDPSLSKFPPSLYRFVLSTTTTTPHIRPF